MDNSRTKIFIFRRAEADIKVSLGSFMSFSAVCDDSAKDIGHYIDYKISRIPRLQKMPSSTKTQIAIVLKVNAHGM